MDTSSSHSPGASLQTLRRALLKSRYRTSAQTGGSPSEGPFEVNVRARTHATVTAASPRGSPPARGVSASFAAAVV